MNEVYVFESRHLIIPVIAAFIGWLTNWIAVKMLFHPKKPINFGLFAIQGVFHKRQSQLAAKLAAVVESKLFSHDDIHDKLVSPEFMGQILPIIEKHLEVIITEKLTSIHPMLAMIPESMVQLIKEKLLEEFAAFLPDVMDGASKALSSQIDIQRVIREKVEAFEVSELEDILFSILKSEFKMIEIVGGVLGFFIGLSQLLLLKYL